MPQRYKDTKPFIIFLSAFVSLWFILFSSCKNHLHPDKKIFHYNESSGLASLDPAFAKNKQVMWAAHQLYNTLIEIDSHMQMQPSLATHWKNSDDNLNFTFYLRNDVFFKMRACPSSQATKLNGPLPTGCLRKSVLYFSTASFGIIEQYCMLKMPSMD